MMPKIVHVDEDDPRIYIEPDLKTLIKEFYYKVSPTDTHTKILKLIETYYVNNEVFMQKYNMQAGKRARKALKELSRLMIKRRMEILSTYKGGKRWDEY